MVWSLMLEGKTYLTKQLHLLLAVTRSLLSSKSMTSSQAMTTSMLTIRSWGMTYKTRKRHFFRISPKKEPRDLCIRPPMVSWAVDSKTHNYKQILPLKCHQMTIYLLTINEINKISARPPFWPNVWKSTKQEAKPILRPLASKLVGDRAMYLLPT